MGTKAEQFQEKMQFLMQHIGQNKYLKSVMTGMLMVLPATIISAAATLIKIFPIQAYQKFLAAHNLAQYFDVPINFTNNFMAVLVSFSVAYSLANAFEVDAFPAGLISMVSFFVLTPYKLGGWTPLGIAYDIPNTWLGAQGMFTGLMVAFLSARLYVWITKKGIIIKMPESVPEFVSKSFSSLVPGMVIITIASVISAVIAANGLGSVHELIYKFLQTPLTTLGGGIGSIIIVSLLAQFLWFFGLHGHSITLGVVAPIWLAMDVKQLAAFSAGTDLPNITGFAFFFTYTAADLLPFAFMLAFMAKSERFKTLGKVAFAPAIFTIGEPMAYGVPLVMNFIFIIPYVFLNAISLGLAYFLTVIHVLPRIAGVSTPPGMPVLISGFLQGSWKIAAFQAISLVVRFAGWYFFFKIADNIAFQEEHEAAQLEKANA